MKFKKKLNNILLFIHNVILNNNFLLHNVILNNYFLLINI